MDLSFLVTADQRYVLWLDGVEIGRGPERGDLRHWFHDAIPVSLSVRPHRLVALVWSLPLQPGLAPAAQMSTQHGFFLSSAPELAETLSTGLGEWKGAEVPGVACGEEMLGRAAMLAGCRMDFDGSLWPTRLDHGEGLGWGDVQVGLRPRTSPGNDNWGSATERLMAPPMLPLRLITPLTAGVVRHVEDVPSQATESLRVAATNCLADDLPRWQAWIDGARSLRLPAGTRQRAIVDLGTYACSYSRLTFRGGDRAAVRVGWAESLFEKFATDGVKGNRGEIEGKTFVGLWDRMRHCKGGSQVLEPLWWSAGRYLEVCVDAGDSELILESFALRETRYPMEREDSCHVPLADWNALHGIMWRTLQVCAHETYMDCPYYEQMQYAGDTRIQMLVTYVSTRDARLPAKALRLFSSSMGADGLTASSYPSSGRQIIPQFSLFWVAMLRDHLYWRGDEALVRSLLPNARRVMDSFLSLVREDGSAPWPPGWNWVDWSEAWRSKNTGPNDGHPLLDSTGLSGINALQLVYVCGLAADLEDAGGESVFADRYRAVREKLMRAARRLFWDEKRLLFADTPSRNSYSEHAQCYAVLTGLLTPHERLGIALSLGVESSLAPATIYFRHYLFEAFAELGCTDRIVEGLGDWRELLAKGFVTTIERPDPSRSDCHAWGAHPIYHLYASLLGIRPASPGFSSVDVRPQLGGLPSLSAKLPHPKGWIEAKVEAKGSQIQGEIVLPEGLEGRFLSGGREVALVSGRNTIPS